MRLKKAEICVLTITVLFLLVTLGYQLGRSRSTAPFAVRTTAESELSPSTPEDMGAGTRLKTGMEAPTGQVNINTAGAEELCTLRGIGETLAARIIAYREEHGAFRSIEDITKVNGIGSDTYKKLRDCITVD